MQNKEFTTIWKAVLENLQESLDYPAYESWIKPVKPIAIEENYFVVTTSNPLSKEWINKNYAEKIALLLSEITGKNLKLKIDVVKENEVVKNTEHFEQEKKHTLSDFQIDALRSTSNNLNLKYTFKTFVIGGHNKFAHAAAQAVAKFPGKAHNPLF